MTVSISITLHKTSNSMVQCWEKNLDFGARKNSVSKSSADAYSSIDLGKIISVLWPLVYIFKMGKIVRMP